MPIPIIVTTTTMEATAKSKLEQIAARNKKTVVRLNRADVHMKEKIELN